jgi:site-specific recombinase XerD
MESIPFSRERIARESQELIDEYVTSTEAAPTTLAKYRAQLQEFAAWLNDPRSESDAVASGGSLRNATALDVQRFMGYLRAGDRFAAVETATARALSASSRKNYLSSLRSFYTFLLIVRLVDTDPTRHIRAPRVRTTPGFRIDGEELERLLAAQGSPRERIITFLLVFTAARTHSLCNLRWSDVDFPSRTILLRGKSDTPHAVSIHPRLMTELRRWCIHQQDLADHNPSLASALADPDTALVLLSRSGRPLSAGAVRKQLKRRAAHAGLHVLEPRHGEHRSRVSPHAIRRSVATLLLNSGHPLDAVADVLHHARVDTTRRHYAFSSPERQRATIDSILN